MHPPNFPLSFVVRTTALVLLFSLWNSTAKAAHYAGASITYECLGGTSYLVNLDLFVDCAGVDPIPQSINFQGDCGTSFTLSALPVPPGNEVSQLCAASLPNSTCNGGVLPGINHFQFQVVVNLAACNDWTISWAICCRNGSNNLVGTPGMYVEANLDNATAPCNNSPVFTDLSIPYVCQGQPVNYNYGVNEPDGNTIVYSLITARYAAPAATPVTYQPGYTGALPVPGITLDPQTGQLSFTPALQGNYVVAVLVEEFDVNGVLIGSVMRDQIFVVINCTGLAPTTTGLSNNTAGLITGTGSIEVCDAEAFCVDVVFSDADPFTVLALSSNALQLLPGASFTVSGTNPAIATLCWTGDIGLTPMNVYIQASDGNCPVENVVSTAINVVTTLGAGAAPDPGVNAVINSCTGAANVDLFTQLGGTPDPGGVWTDPIGASHNGTFVPGTDAGGLYTYTVGNSCVSASATVTVNLGISPNAGVNGALNVCSNGASSNLLAQLGGTPQAGGAWSGPSPVIGDNYDPATMAPGVYTYTVTGVAPCVNATATITVTENAATNAGTSGALDVCSNGASSNLFAQLGGTPQAGGAWSGPSPVAGGNYDPATMAPGAYTYTVTGIAPCANATATITVTENAATDAGISGTLDLCSNGPSSALFAQLGGTPQAGGAWSGPSPVVGGNYDPATMTPGAYTYTVTGIAPCTNATATITVTENAATNAGTNGTLDVCSNGASSSLFAQLGGTPQAGGAWGGPSPVVGGNYDPATMAPGAYTYTVTGIAPCTNATATITVTENAATDAGLDGTLDVCSNGASSSLFAQLGGTPQAGGAWGGPSPVVGGNYDPATMAPGAYTYTVTGIAPCTNATATITVTENAATNAGTNGTLDVCSNGASSNLFAQLGGTPQAGGAWSGPSPVAGGNYDPATMTPGAYTYTVTGVAPCVNATATITVTENAATNAGTNGTLDLCSSAAAQSLFAQLGGTPQAGGAWSGPSPVAGGNYDPATMAPGAYTYTVTGIAPCANATATITVTENASTDAGISGTLDLCSNGPSSALFAQLGGTPQAGGAWGGPSPVVGGNYDPATMTPGAYTYTVTGIAPCTNATATITVTENAATNAGTNGTLDVCSNGASSSLFAQLGGTPQAGGAWGGPSPVVGGNYDPATMAPGVYTYTVTGVAPCADATATITVTENAATDAGLDGTLDVCSNGASSSLFAQLGGTPQAGGAWGGPSPVVGGNYDPAAMAPGAYIYTVTGIAPCTNATATITVTENAATDAGINGTLDVCSNGPSSALFAQLGGTPQAGGAWSGPSAVAGGNYDPATMAPGVYTYTMTGVAPCANATATITVTENTAPDAGSDGAVTVCDQGATIGLFAELGGTPGAGGTWTDPNGVAHSGNFDPSTDIAGTYTYSIGALAPCVADQSIVAVTITSSPDAGVDGAVTVCDQGAAIGLLAELGGTPDAGGTWTDPNGVAHSGNFDPATDIAGNYTYSIGALAPCVADQSIVAVTITSSPDAGVDGAVTVCDQGAGIGLLAELGGTPDAGGTWTDPNGVAHSGSFDPATDIAGNYTYSIGALAPCVADQSIVAVSITSSPDAGVDGAVTVCDQGAAIGLFAELGGTPDAGGTWTDPNGIAHSGSFDPATDIAGNYTYSIGALAPCVADQSIVTVTITSSPDAGIDGVVSVCDQGAVIGLFAELGGTPDPGGTWTDPNGIAHSGSFDPATDIAGNYTYSIGALAPCVADQSIVTVTITSSPDAGIDGAVTACDQGAAIGLFAELGGSPDAGGTWTDPNGIAHSGSFDPATDIAGNYTYSIGALAPCVADQSIVAVTITSSPDAGLDGAVTVCDQGAAIGLFAELGGTPDAGGTWTDPNGAAHSGNFDPATDIAGTYTYSIGALAPCVADQSIVTVTITSSPDAGVDGVVTVCDQGAAIGLFAELGGTPDAGGTWTDPNGVAHSGSFDPSTDIAGNYTYSIGALAPCVADQSIVAVTITSSPDAGVDGAVTVCDQGAAIGLFAELGGSPDAGGTWTDPNGIAHSGSFDPATDIAGNYTYSIGALAPCVADQSIVTVTITSSPDAGVDGAVTVCDQGAAIGLFAELGGTPDAGGTWTDPNGVAHSGSFDPSTDIAGNYTYSIGALAPCVADQSIVAVTITSSPDAGVDGAVTVCDQGAAIGLFAELGGSPDAGGTWTDPNGIAHSGSFDPATDIAGNYTYSIGALAPCVADQSIVTVTITSSPDAGVDGAVTVCDQGAAIGLLAELGGTPDAGGTWTDPNGVAHSGSFDPSTDIAGNYMYSIGALAPCTGDQSTISVSLEISPNAGTDGTLSLCAGSPIADLFVQLTGSPDATGVWTDPNGLAHTGSFDAGNDPTGSYVYTVSGTLCPSDASIVVVDVLAGPDAGQDNAVAVCETAAVLDMLTVLLGSPDAGGTWTDPNNDPVPAILDPQVAIPGNYTYSIPGNGACPSDEAVLTITIAQTVNAGSPGAIMLCSSAGPTDLYSQLTGTPQPGGAWTDPFGLSVPALFDPATGVEGAYTYIVTGNAPCPDASTTVVVEVEQAPEAGDDAVSSLCSSSAAVPLNTLLNGTPDGGGSWIAPNGMPASALLEPSSAAQGTYQYIVPAVQPCVNDTAQVTITISTAANAGSDGSLALCSNAPPVGLFPQLGGTPDSGGTWIGPHGSPLNPVIDPSSAFSGTYTYTVVAIAPCANDAATVEVTITVLPDPQVAVSLSDGCVPVLAAFTTDYTGPGSFVWDLGNDSISTESAPDSILYSDAGVYDVTLLIDAGGGCVSTTVINDAVHASVPPVASFEPLPGEVTTLDPAVYFHNLTVGANAYAWTFADLGTSEEQDPRFVFPAELEGEYEVCLVAFSAPTCADTACLPLVVYPTLIVNVPNAFTPDGDDINDSFRPVTVGVDPDHYLFQVFDRWGQPLFSTQDPLGAWNGRFMGNEEVPSGVYIWKLEAKGISTTARIERTGHVTLVR